MSPAERLRAVDSTSVSTRRASAISSSESDARAVSRSREVPAGTVGGRKQPTRTPRSRHAVAAANATSGAPRITDTTADSGRSGTSHTLASSAEWPSTACARQGSAVSTRSAAHAAPTAAGASPVSKMNGRAASIEVVAHRDRPQHRAALAAQRLGHRHRHHDIGRTGQPGLLQQATPTGPPHPEPVRLVDDQQRAVAPAHVVELTHRREVAVGAEHRVRDDHRALLVAGRQLPFHRGDVPMRP